MAWFFTSGIVTPLFTITGEDARHIERSLRMVRGETLMLCDGAQTEHSCVIEEFSPAGVEVRVTGSRPCQNEPSVQVTLYQAMPKGDKMDAIIQKAVELGAHAVVPVISARCISRPDEKSLRKKEARWQKIARQAAEQSRRGIIPRVGNTIPFDEAARQGSAADASIIFYECGGDSVKTLIPPGCKTMAIFIGSEGGFEESEVRAVLQNGGRAATLGKRVLRAETAPLAALAVLMHETGNQG